MRRRFPGNLEGDLGIKGERSDLSNRSINFDCVEEGFCGDRSVDKTTDDRRGNHRDDGCRLEVAVNS